MSTTTVISTEVTVTATPTSSLVSTAPTATATTTSPATNSTNSDGNTDSGVIPMQSVFYFIAFLGLMLGVAYTVYIARRDRRRRRAARAGLDPEMGERRANTTYRPGDSGDEACPPQYRCYMLDQQLDPETVVVYPEQAHYGTQQGLIQHLDIVGEQERAYNSNNDQTQSLEQDPMEPILTTTTTTITTTTMRTTLSPRVSMSEPMDTSLPLTSTTEPAQNFSAESLSSETGSPSAPAPAHAFLNGRHFSILRMGLSNYNRRRNGGLSSISSSRQTSRASSQPTTPTASRSTSPSRAQSMIVPVPVLSVSATTTTPTTTTTSTTSTTSASSPTITTTSPTGLSTIPNTNNLREAIANRGDTLGSSSSSVMTERSEDSRSGLMLPHSLYRLRSTGPPPYVPSSSDEAPPLPPSYNVAVETI